jgi:hypothetical protein
LVIIIFSVSLPITIYRILLLDLPLLNLIYFPIPSAPVHTHTPIVPSTNTQESWLLLSRAEATAAAQLASFAARESAAAARFEELRYAHSEVQSDGCSQ